MAKTRRKLTDLYRREDIVTIDDGTGDPVDVLVRKMSPVDYEKAYRKANAFRAKILTVNNEESDYFQSTKNEIVELERDELIDYLANADTAKNMVVIEAEVAGEKKWTTDEYIVGLMDAWEGGLSETYAKDPEDEEAKAVFEKMKEYREEVDAKILEYADTCKQGYKMQTDAELQDKATKDMLKLNADLAWMNEYRRWEIFLSSYDPETRERIFESRDEIDELSPEVLAALSAKIEDLVVDLVEGKDSSQPASS